MAHKKLPGNIRFGGTDMSSKKSSRTISSLLCELHCVRMERTFHAIFRSATNLSQNNLSFERTADNKTEFD